MTTTQPTEEQIKKQLVPEQGINIQNIVIRPVQRHSQDIEKWRQALKSAEMINGYRVLLYDLYAEILLDGVLKNLVQKRVQGVTKNRLVYRNADGTENEEISKLLKSKQGRKLRKEIQLQKAWGISLLELSIKNGKFNVYSVSRKNIRPKIGMVTLEQYGNDGYAYRDAPYNRTVLEVGHYDDLGYILEASPYVIYKRGGFGDWAQFAQIFGAPFREAKYDGYNDVVRQQLINALEQMGNAGYGVFPKDTEIKLHEASNNQGSSQLYNDLRKACNEELAILVLGQNATTQQTPGKLGNQDTQEQTEDDINLDDREDELAIFNEDVKPILINLGYTLDDGGEFMHQPEEEKLKPNEFISMASNAQKMGLPIDHEQLYEVSGLRKPDDYNAQIQAQNEARQAAQQQPDNKPPQPGKPKGKPAQQTKLSMGDRFLAYVADFFAPAPKS